MASNINQKQESVLNNQKASDIDLILSEAATIAKRVVRSDGTHVRRSVMGPQPLPSNYLPPNLNQLISRNITQQNLVPPLPPRPGQMSNYNYYGGGNMYNQFPRYGAGMYAPSYGGYRTSYNRLGSPYYEGGMENNSIIQLAEESTRPAFQSIETIVEAVGSISMMLESTYHAVHSSYSAILGVVDNFSRLKDRLTEMLSVLALLRGLQWLCLKVLYLLGIRKSDPSNEAAWSAASNAANNLFNVSGTTNSKQSAWPILMFISLVFGAPWLMFRLLANKVANKPFDPNLWITLNGNHQVAMVMYDFTSSRPGELSVCAGQRLILAPRSLQPKSMKGWVLASQDLKSSGLVPANYLKSLSVNGSQVPNAQKGSPATVEAVPDPTQSNE